MEKNGFKQKLLEFKDKKNVLWMLGILIFILAIGVLAYENSFYYQLYFNGEEVGIVQEKVIVENALINTEEEVSKKFSNKAYFKKEIRVEKVRVKQEKPIDQDQLVDHILQHVEIYKPAAIITVDGQEKLVLDTKDQAKNILDNIKKRSMEIIQTKQEKFELIETTFKQDIEIVSKDVLVDTILTTDEALSVIEKDKEQVQTHKVALGDNAWTISRAYNMDANKLEQANSNKDIKDLKPGETVNLVVEKPFADVTTKIKQIDKAEIDYKVEEKKDSSLYTGVNEVKQEGEKGEKEVTKEITYVNGVKDQEKVIEEKVNNEPITKIILVGTKNHPAPSSVVPSSAAPSSAAPSSAVPSSAVPSSAAPSSVAPSSVAPSSAAPTYNGDVGSTVVAIAKDYIGIPYVSGGSSPSGFDCSGFTQYVYRQYGISIPRTSGGQGSAGSQISRSDLKPGDLVTFSGHVGIYVGNDSFIHSPSPGKSIQITSLSSSYWNSRFISGRRVY